MRKRRCSSRIDGVLVGILKDIAEEEGTTLYALGQDLEIPKASIYHHDKNPGQMPLERWDAVRKRFKKTWAQMVPYLERAMRK